MKVFSFGGPRTQDYYNKGIKPLIIKTRQQDGWNLTIQVAIARRRTSTVEATDTTN
jgi:hypothetical protein